MRFKITFETNSDIPNDFIYKFLNKVNPTYSVIYIYTFSKVFNGYDDLNYSDISREIEFVTEGDVNNAFTYFCDKKIVEIYDNEILFLPIYEETEKIKETIDINFEIDKKPTYSMAEIEYYRKNNRDVDNLFLLAERNFGKTLSPEDISDIFDIYERLLLPVEVIEYLLEQYTSKGISNMGYITKVANEWHDRGIKTKEQAVRLVNISSEDYIKIRKALGNSSKNEITPAEEKMINKFYNEYNFDLDIILEACDSVVITSSGIPSYSYLDGKLKEWHLAGATTLEDVIKIEEEIKLSRKTPKKSAKSGNKNKNKFANFSQKSLDFDKYERLNQERLDKLAKGENI